MCTCQQSLHVQKTYVHRPPLVESSPVPWLAGFAVNEPSEWSSILIDDPGEPINGGVKGVEGSGETWWQIGMEKLVEAALDAASLF